MVEKWKNGKMERLVNELKTIFHPRNWRGQFSTGVAFNLLAQLVKISSIELHYAYPARSVVL
jgi:hypothetical protein